MNVIESDDNNKWGNKNDEQCQACTAINDDIKTSKSSGKIHTICRQCYKLNYDLYTFVGNENPLGGFFNSFLLPFGCLYQRPCKMEYSEPCG